MFAITLKRHMHMLHGAHEIFQLLLHTHEWTKQRENVWYKTSWLLYAFFFSYTALVYVSVVKAFVGIVKPHTECIVMWHNCHWVAKFPNGIKRSLFKCCAPYANCLLKNAAKRKNCKKIPICPMFICILIKYYISHIFRFICRKASEPLLNWCRVKVR